MNNIFHPGIFLIVCGIIAAILPGKLRRIPVIGGPAIILIAFFRMPIGTTDTLVIMDHIHLNYLNVTNENYLFLFVFSVIALIAGIYAAHTNRQLESFAALNYAGASICVAMAGDWLTMLVFWEYMAVTSLCLVWCSQSSRSSNAGFRYLIMHMLGGNLLLFGVLIKLFHGSTAITCITGQYDISFWLIFLGVAVNAAVVPLHTWVPDAYPEASLSGTIYMASFTTKIAILSMLRIFSGEQFLIVLGVIMMLYGAVFALMENNLRRVLSYHIISQLGFMVIDIGIGGEIGANASIALAFSNIIYKAVLFMCAGAIIKATGISKISQLGGLAKKMPIICVCFFIAALSIAGVPPFAGFTCKSLSMEAVHATGSHLLEILMLVGSIGTALSILFKMGYFTFFGKDRDIKVKPIPKNMYVAIIAGAGLCILFGAAPNLVYNMLPYPEHYHVYSLHHLLEYMQLIPAALLAFVLYLKNMAPHDTITLDLDWLARRPFKKGFYGFSGFLADIQASSDSFGVKFQRKLGLAAANPLKHTPNKGRKLESRETSPNRFDEDAYRPQIGGGMLAVFITVIIIGVFIILKHFIQI